MKIISLIFYGVICILLLSCQEKGNSNHNAVTRKIETLDEACERVRKESNCSISTINNTSTSKSKNEDTNPPFTISKQKCSGFNAWTIKENKNKVAEITGKYYYEICPKGLFDKPISQAKKRALEGAPVSYKDATWSAAFRALNNLIPQKDSKIIFDFSKFNRQVNNEYECLFFGSCQIKNEKGKYVDAEVSILVKYIFAEDMREPNAWYCIGNIVF